MTRPFGWMRGAIASAALAVAGAVAAWAANPVGTAWTADPEEQFMLDVNIRQLQLGDGVRAYPTPQGTCVIFGDFLTTLDVPMNLDLQTERASGWAFREQNRIDIDRKARAVSYGGKTERIEDGAIRETPEGWCVETQALTRWFGIGVKPLLAGSLLQLESEAKLPVELAIERQKRAAQLKKAAALPAESLSKVKIPYRMWRAPMMEFVVSAGVTYDARTGANVDRAASMIMAGEVAGLSYTASVATDTKGRPNRLNFQAYRSDPDGGLLGPLDATHFAVGDVGGVTSRLLPFTNGRGAEISNRPLFTATNFDKTRFEGDLPPGWDAELYRNGMLVTFAASDASGRYRFEDVQLAYGENRFEIILYGPQGQTRSRFETLNIGDLQVPKGQTWYSVSVSQPGRPIVDLAQRTDNENPSQKDSLRYDRPDLQAAVSVEHGVSKRTTIGALAAVLLNDHERVTFVEGSVRQSVGSMIVEGAIARDNSGGTAARVQALGRVGRLNVSAEAVLGNDFIINGRREERYRDARLSFDLPVKIGRQPFAAQADVRFREQGAGNKTVTANARLSTNFNGFNLTGIGRWERLLGQSGTGQQADRFDLALIGTGRIKRVRLRGEAEFEVSPQARLRQAMLSAYWSASDTADLEGGLGYDARNRRAVGRVGYVRRFSALSAAASLEAGTDGSVAAGINLNFSLDHGAKGLRLTNQKLATNGTVEARVFRDLNDNGRRDSTEPYEKDVLVTSGTRLSEQATDADGRVRVYGLTPNVPVAIGIDSSSLSSPNLAPRKALQQVTPRAGVAAQVEIALVGSGDIEGVLARADGRGHEGVDVELIDDSGRVVATARSDYDGFILFERVPYGRYTLRISQASAKATGLSTDLDRVVLIDADHTVVRLGTLRTRKAGTIASIDASQPSLR